MIVRRGIYKLETDGDIVATLNDAAKKKGLTTATFFWPETYGDPSVDYNLAERDSPQGDADLKPQRL